MAICDDNDLCKNDLKLLMKGKILHLLDRVHNVRVLSNHDDIGFGLDIYKRQLKYHYDEAYALWGLGYLNLHKLDSYIADVDSLHHVVKYFDKNIRYDGSFGLPWDWEGQKKEDGYLITTAFVGIFLQNYNTLFNNTEVDVLINQIEDYILSLKESLNGHKYLRYSKYKNEDVLNAYAVAMLFLVLHDYERNCELVEQLVDSIKDGQTESGGFIYMLYPQANIDIPDNYHQCFIINSLLRINDFLSKNGLKKEQKMIRIADNGISYFMSNFFDEELSIIRRVNKPLFGEDSFHYRKTKVWWIVGRLKRKLLRQPPSRSNPIFYDYGQTLAFLSTDIDKYSRHIQAVINQAENALKSINESNLYIRDFGHFFYGLTEVLIKLS